MVNWEELTLNILISVIISGTLSFFVARHFKLNVKPKIEEIYEYNREFRIHNISSILEFSDWNMKEIFDVLEQNNCVGTEFRHVNLSDELLENIKERVFRLDQAYDDVYKRIEEAGQYAAGDELFLFLDFMTNSKAFAEDLSKEKYNPQYLRRRGKNAKKLVEHFREFFSRDFIKKWDDIEDSRLESPPSKFGLGRFGIK